MIRLRNIAIVTMSMLLLFGVPKSMFAAHPNNATNIYMWSHIPNGGAIPATDIVTIDWAATETYPYTYWATQQFNNGYAGFQQHDNKTTAHFALWDEVENTDNKIVVDYASPATTTNNFGGEGTGVNASTVYPWKENEWQRMVIRSWKQDNRTLFGQWVRNPEGQWLLTSILSHPNPNAEMTGSSLFQEDWAGRKDYSRGFKMKNHYSKVKGSSEWLSHDTQTVNNSRGDSEKVWDAGTTDDYFWGKAGGNTQATIPNGTVLKVNQPAKPTFDDIKVDKFNVHTSGTKLTTDWSMNEKSSPQFKAQVIVKNNGKVVKTFDEVRSYDNEFSTDYTLAKDDTVHLAVTDIFDNKKEFPEDGTSSGNGEAGGNGGSEGEGSPETPEGTEEHAYAVDFLGYADVKFAEFTYDSTANEGVLESLAINQAPHNNFDEDYATVTVQNKNGKELFKKAYKGTQRLTGATDKIPVEEGYYLTFTHLEADGKPTSRMQIVDKTQETQLENAKSITYEVTKTGWEKADKPEESEYPETPEIPEQTGKRYEAKFKNPSDKDFAIFNFDLNTSKGYLATKKGKPNEAYGDKNYAKIVVQDQNGEEVFKQNYKGNKSYSNKVEQMDIEEGYTITFMHKDKNFTLIEKTENEQLKVKKEITYKVTKNGLKKLG